MDYLLKPFSFQRFVKAVAKVPGKPSAATPSEVKPDKPAPPSELFIKSGYEFIKIMINDIIFLQSDTDYTELLIPGKRILSTEPLRYWEETLDPGQFVRIHKSYIVNTAKIEKIAGNQVYLKEEIVVPIGRAYKDEFIKRVLK